MAETSKLTKTDESLLVVSGSENVETINLETDRIEFHIFDLYGNHIKSDYNLQPSKNNILQGEISDDMIIATQQTGSVQQTT